MLHLVKDLLFQRGKSLISKGLDLITQCVGVGVLAHVCTPVLRGGLKVLFYECYYLLIGFGGSGVLFCLRH